jgi:hypothetical protein
MKEGSVISMRKCVFCPSTKLTQEHVWGNWVNGILPPEIAFTTRRKTSPTGDFKEWRTIGLSQTAGVACRACNNGWMSDLETNEAKPAMADMIRYGGPVSLLPRGTASISAWAFKMTVIANSIGVLKEDEPYFSTIDRHNFAKTLQIPSGIQMWLFALKTPGRVTGKFNSHLGRLPIHVKYAFDLYIATFALGYLGVQVIATRWRNPHAFTILGAFPGLRESAKWNGTTLPLFPTDGSPVHWPPRLHLNSNSIDGFCNRWKDVNMPQWMVDGSLV